ncbi:7,8-didemethyl-8-hydroxy-5-deazariboflavin synthase CofG [Alkalihalobacterium alkalinitrilicum]|uniref:7,8-didemethyl-8-hydroxy-5-deazariboflavin synthase CofG n=1 Tax=Alkalihalobacterium alkalinitrilicum TaxID=427920 RepID=UPI0009958DF6|nr:7,8-didemethyl-8-hydroxy-5-deazariboflavin synthase CofG [Alkalihalobacterium alkalinitrilicum]
MIEKKDLDNILFKAEQGLVISRKEAYQLGSITDSVLKEMQNVSSKIRRRSFGTEMSYTQNVFIPLTNICKDYCSYCTFRKDPHHPEANIMSPEEVLSIVKKGKDLGCTEVLFSLGDKSDYFPEVREWLNRRGYRNMPEYLEDMCKMVIEETGLLPHTNVGVLDRYHLARMRRYNPSMGMMLETVSERLYAKGEVHGNAPDKKPSRRIRYIEEAGKLKIPFTTGILIGIGETWEERIDSLFKIKELHEKYGHISEVIIQNFKAKPDTPMANYPEPTFEDLIHTVCVANFIFQGSIHLQVPPNLNSAHLQELLKSGIDDWGGISPLTIDYINPESPWPHREQLLEITRKAGYVPKQRLPIYPDYIKPDFIDEKLFPYVLKLTDSQGYRADVIPL